MCGEPKKFKTIEVEKLAENWKSRNKWYGHKRFQAETLFAAQIDAYLTRRGLNQHSPEYFRELDRLVAERMPDLKRRAAEVLGQLARRRDERRQT